MDPILSTATFAGIAEPHQRTVAGILRAAGRGLFTAAEADIFIDRIRAHVTASPVEFSLSVEEDPPAVVSELGSSALPHGLDGIV
jgi:hypothetical protein